MPEGTKPRLEGAHSPGASGRWTWRAWPAVLFGAAILLGSFLLYRTLTRYDSSEILAAISAASPWRLLSACAFAAASYICLTGFDWMALRYVGHPLSYRRTALASFTALSLGHNIGFAALSSGAVRYRFYSRWGLGTFEVAKVILFCGITVGLGLASLGGLAILLQPRLATQITGLQPMNVLYLGAACLAVPLAYLAVAAAGLQRLRFRQWALEMPPLRLALGQILLGTLNFTFVAACLHQALNAISPVPYPAAATVYVIANTATLISHVPGGLGVVESTVLFLLPGQSSIAAVLIFRAVYFLLPLCVGLSAFVLSELRLRGRPVPTAT
jgi:glycosyltransferase 2 family protein